MLNSNVKQITFDGMDRKQIELKVNDFDMVRCRYIRLTKVRHFLKASIETLNRFKISKLDNQNSINELQAVLIQDMDTIKTTLNSMD